MINEFLVYLIKIFNIIVSLFYKNKPVILEKKDPLKDYIEKYKKKFDDLDVLILDDDKLESLKNCILFEVTPLANVIMYYDHSIKKFNYYSDKSLSYSFIESACRNYVLKFNCKMLYVDIEKEYEIVKDKIKRKEEETDKKQDEKPENEKSLYVKPKSYNEKKKPKPRATIDENKSKILDFKYCGRIRDFNFLKINKKKVNSYKIKNISFSDFKKRSNY